MRDLEKSLLQIESDSKSRGGISAFNGLLAGSDRDITQIVFRGILHYIIHTGHLRLTYSMSYLNMYRTVDSVRSISTLEHVIADLVAEDL